MWSHVIEYLTATNQIPISSKRSTFLNSDELIYRKESPRYINTLELGPFIMSSSYTFPQIKNWSSIQKTQWSFIADNLNFECFVTLNLKSITIAPFTPLKTHSYNFNESKLFAMQLYPISMVDFWFWSLRHNDKKFIFSWFFAKPFATIQKLALVLFSERNISNNKKKTFLFRSSFIPFGFSWK